MGTKTTTQTHRLTGDEAKTEREIVVRFDDHKDVVSVFTASPVVDRKVRRAGYAPGRVSTVRGREVGWFYRIPYAELRWGFRRQRARPAGPSQSQGGGPGGRPEPKPVSPETAAKRMAGLRKAIEGRRKA